MNEFAKVIRILRIERGEVLKDMANKLNVTSSYLSAIECGKRQIPNDLISRLKEIYSLSENEVEKFEDAKARTENHVEIKIPFSKLNCEQQEVALKFARSFNPANSEVDMSNLIDKLRKLVDIKEDK